MAITGGIKFFDRSKSLAVDGADAVASSGDASADFILDRNRFTFWRSVGSSDVTTETITITMSSSITFDRILLINHNFESFDVQFDSGGFTDFSSVIGLDGAPPGPGIAETAFADDTAYYEFDSVTTTIVRIRATVTQTTDAEKFLNQMILTSEQGTFVGFPVLTPTHRRSLTRQVLSGKSIVEKLEDSFQGLLSFSSYPVSGTFNADINLMLSIFESEDDFIIWPSGGRRGTTFFGNPLRAWRLEDAFTCNVVNNISPAFLQNVHILPINAEFELHEVV